jgi:hypothetical protein
MKFFKMEGMKLILDYPEVLLINEFRNLVDRDKTPNHEDVYKELVFIYFYCDFNSPHIHKQDDKRKADAIREARLPASWRIDALVKNAIDKYNELQNTASVKLLINLKQSLENASSVVAIANQNISFYLKALEKTNLENIFDDIEEMEKYIKKRQVLSDELDRLFNQATKIEKSLETLESVETRVKTEVSDKSTILSGNKPMEGRMDP